MKTYVRRSEKQTYYCIDTYKSSSLRIFFAVTVTRNGFTITGPVLIYQDELIRLVCSSEEAQFMSGSSVAWYLPDSKQVNASSTPSSGDFEQHRSISGNNSVLSSTRAGIARIDAATNGLWTCRLNGLVRGAVPVGIYARGGGEHMKCQVSSEVSKYTEQTIGQIYRND